MYVVSSCSVLLEILKHAQYGIRFQNDTEVDNFMQRLSEEVHQRLKKEDLRGKSITLKVMKRDPSAPVEAAKVLLTSFFVSPSYLTRYVSLWDMACAKPSTNSQRSSGEMEMQPMTLR